MARKKCAGSRVKGVRSASPRRLQKSKVSSKRIKSIPFKILSKEEMESHQHVVAHHVGKIVNHNGDVSSSEDESILSDSGSDQDF